MVKYTANTLKRLEEIFKELGYTVRHGRGNFKSGSCVLEDNKVIVINKYFSIEARIASLLEILNSIEPDLAYLSKSNRDFYYKIVETPKLL